MELSYAHGASDVSLLGETIGANLERTVARVPDAEALVSRHQGQRYTYSEFNDAVDEVARGLIGLGARGGRPDRHLEPQLRGVGAAPVRQRQGGRDPREHQPRVPDVGARLRARQVGLPRARVGALVQDLGLRGDGARGGARDEQTIYLGSSDWDELLRAGSGQDLRSRANSLQFDEPINIQYTSGTTGFPKGATLSHHNILNNGFFIGEYCRYTEADRVCIPVPFYHCFGMVLGNLACTTHGACIVMPEAAFEPRSVLETVEAERCTSLYGVPTMFIAELDHPEFDQFDYGSLRTGIMAGSPCPVEVMRKVVERMHMDEVTICYGMTETVAGVDPDRRGRQRRAAGVDGRPRAPARRGQDHRPAHGPDRAARRARRAAHPRLLGDARLLERPRAHRRGDRPARWMHTGDLATMDDEGYVNIVGRSKDMIIRGGENVYPREIEEFLYTHPDVSDVAVIGVPDDKYGEEIMAWVQVREGSRAHRRRAARLLPRQDRALQDPALRRGRRRVPDDDHRQGAEVQDARGGGGEAGPRGGRHRLGEKLVDRRTPAATCRRASAGTWRRAGCGGR